MSQCAELHVMREKIRRLLVPMMDRWLDPKCDVLLLCEHTPMDTEGLSDEEARELLQWAEAGGQGDPPRPLAQFLAELRAAGLLRSGQ